jgi:hypothetical protein
MSLTHRKTEEKTRDALETARGKIALGNKVVRSLRKAAMGSGSRRAYAVAEMVARCVDSQNVFLAEGMKNKQGETFTGYSTLYHCRQRVCPFCCSTLRRRSRKVAAAAVDELVSVATNDVHFRFVTLTQPVLPGVSIIEAISIIQYAWSLLRKREFWKSRVHGGVKAIEFEPKGEGYHAHIHLVVFSEFIEVNKDWEERLEKRAARRELYPGNLRSEWTSCIRAAWERVEIDAEIKTPTGELIVNVKEVRDKKSGHSFGGTEYKALGDVLNEVSKYVTKNTSWLKIPAEQLVEVVSVKRWARMFEVFGSCRRAKAEPDDVEVDAVESKDIEHARLEEHTTTSLDTRRIIDGEKSSDLPKESPKDRPPSLLDQAEIMDWDRWKILLDFHVYKATLFRLKQLSEKYPEMKIKSIYHLDMLALDYDLRLTL